MEGMLGSPKALECLSVSELIHLCLYFHISDEIFFKVKERKMRPLPCKFTIRENTNRKNKLIEIYFFKVT